MKSRTREIEHKISIMRRILRDHGASAIRLRGSDWFAWATAGGSNVILFTTDLGVAEICVTAHEAVVLTDAIEYDRLREEEVPEGYQFFRFDWAKPEVREQQVAELAAGGLVLSDRPSGAEKMLPSELIHAKCVLTEDEKTRYRSLGRGAAEAMTETLTDARPDWSGYELAARGASALWQRGINPALILVGDEKRLPLHRHATTSSEKIGSRAMLVFCARQYGLFANLTRFVYFRDPTPDERKSIETIARIEADILAATAADSPLGDVFAAAAHAYAKHGHAGEILKHHQGGTTGYNSREEVARPGSRTRIAHNMAFAWNPSLVGCKIEDTMLLGPEGFEILTVDPRWPTVAIKDRPRPDILVRS